ncbi:MAG TPA: hypothetical protein VG077_02085 [Verrucomicrobiae bacterium]|nr:hypothetical protein [Verrucomicrobiae bacterium]
MGIIDFILNLAGLLLWLNWRSLRFDPLGQRRPATLIGTLRRAEPRRLRRWHLPAVLAGLLFLRAVLYWQIGSGVGWAAGKLDLGVIELSFRSDLFGRILLFSFCSFGLTLGVFYLWLLLFSILAGPEPFHRLVRMQLGPIDRLPRGIKLALPLALVAPLWWLASWLLAWLAIVPPPVSAMHRLEAALVIGLGSYLAWKFAAGVLLVLHLLNSYIYFGKYPFWNYVTAEAQTLLRPLHAIPLRAGKVDFAPVLGTALVFLLAELAGRGLAVLYLRLPL